VLTMTLSGLVAGVVLGGVCAVVDVAMQRFMQGMGMALSVWTVLIGVSVVAVVVAMGRGWRGGVRRGGGPTRRSHLRQARAGGPPGRVTGRSCSPRTPMS